MIKKYARDKLLANENIQNIEMTNNIIRSGDTITFAPHVTRISHKLLTGYIHNHNFEHVIIPESVTHIEAYAFARSNIRELTLPKTLIHCGKYAFNLCVNLEKVTILSEIRKLPDWIFALCSRLKEIHLPHTIQELGDGVFYQTGLTHYTVPKSITELPDYCFCGCHNLTHVDIHDQIEHLGVRCFSNCRKLENFHIHAHIQSVGDCAFENCNMLIPKITPRSTPRSIGIGVFKHCINIIECDLVSLNPIEIKAETFQDCKRIRYLKIQPHNIPFAHNAFQGCKKIQAVITGEKNKESTLNDLENWGIKSPNKSKTPYLISCADLKNHEKNIARDTNYNLKDTIFLYRIRFDRSFISSWRNILRQNVAITIYDLIVSTTYKKETHILPKSCLNTALRDRVVYLIKDGKEDSDLKKNDVNTSDIHEESSLTKNRPVHSEISLPLFCQFFSVRDYANFSATAKNITIRYKTTPENNPNTTTACKII